LKKDFSGFNHFRQHGTTGKGKKYSDDRAEDMITEDQFMQRFQNRVNEFSIFVQQKGKVKPNKYRHMAISRPSITGQV
jgi:hypothetical protein